MPTRSILPSLLLAMGLFSPLMAVDLELVKKVEEFGSEVWIENATKTLVDGPTAEGKALRIEVPTKTDEEWQAQTWIRPLAENIAEGDTIVIAFEGRAIEPATAQIKVSVGLGDAPYTQVVGKKIELGQTWQKYEITGVAKSSLLAADGRFGFTFGKMIQTFEICHLTVTSKRN